MAAQPKKKAFKSVPPSRPLCMPWIWGGTSVLALTLGGFFRWQGQQAARGFEALVAQGKAGLPGREVRYPDAGRGHGTIGVSIAYTTDPPTFGVHWPNWMEPGFYTRAEPKAKLVHTLEHGNIVIYYDRPSDEALDQLRRWQHRFTGQWDGLVVVHKQGLGQTIELTAWNKLLHLETWDAALAAVFNAYRGGGPENPVC